MKKILGIILISLPFIMAFVVVYVKIGILVAVGMFFFTFILSALVLLGVELLD